MLQKLKSVGLAAVFAVAAPIAAFAIPMSGQLDFGGFVNDTASDFTAGTGNVAFADNPIIFALFGDVSTDGLVTGATGAFTGLVSQRVELNDFSFASAPTLIWSVGGFTFTATNFTDVGSGDFKANGLVADTNGVYDNTLGNLFFTSQADGTKGTSVSFSSTTVVPLPAGLLLMGTALAGLGLARRMKS